MLVSENIGNLVLVLLSVKKGSRELTNPRLCFLLHFTKYLNFCGNGVVNI